MSVLPKPLNKFLFSRILILMFVSLFTTLEAEDYSVHFVPCHAQAGSLQPLEGEVCANNSAGSITAVVDTPPIIPQGFSVAYVLTSRNDGFIENYNFVPAFMVSDSGVFRIHTFVYDSTTLDLNTLINGLNTIFQLDSLLIQGGGSICASLDLSGAVFYVQNPYAGTLSTANTSICDPSDTVNLSAIPNGDMIVPNGFDIIYLLTSGLDLTIQQINNQPDFEVSAAKVYTIHAFVYDSSAFYPSDIVQGSTTVYHVDTMLTQGEGNICGSLSIAGLQFQVIGPELGEITADFDTVCTSGGQAIISASQQGSTFIPIGFVQYFILSSDTDKVIEQVSPYSEFPINGGGIYYIHSFILDPSTFEVSQIGQGINSIPALNSVLLQGGDTICAVLNVEGIKIVVNDPDAGSLSADNYSVCYNGGSITISASLNNDVNIPGGYSIAYLLTSGAGITVEAVSTNSAFIVDTTGLYNLHSLVYDAATLRIDSIITGTSTLSGIFSMLVEGGGSICASLDLIGTQIRVVKPEAGSITIDLDTVCTINGQATITINHTGDASIPGGFVFLYLLTSTENQIIRKLSFLPEFNLNEGGSFRIYTLLFDSTTFDLDSLNPVTSIQNINDMITQGGGSICASLDLTGVSVTVSNPNAGTLTAEVSSLCYSSGLTISAIPDDTIVPGDYLILYILSSGDSMIIVKFNDQPIFEPSGVGSYNIHTLVYNPFTFDTSNLDQFTDIPDLYSTLTEGGGDICASLSFNGVSIDVSTLKGSTISAFLDTVCLSGNVASISAFPDSNVQAPQGFEIAYVLTSGTDMIVEDISTFPEFGVLEGGIYQLHILIYDSSIVDLSGILFGITSLLQLENLLIQAGGCHFLSQDGAEIIVEAPEAGSLSTVSDSVILKDSAKLAAFNTSNSIIPSGYIELFILTKGNSLEIVEIRDTALFIVDSTGFYSIHTIVFNPSDLDLAFVDPGLTTLYDIHTLFGQGGGAVCGALDLTGIPIEVVDGEKCHCPHHCCNHYCNNNHHDGWHSWFWFFWYYFHMWHEHNHSGNCDCCECHDDGNRIYDTTHSGRELPVEVKVYPNPTSDYLKIAIKNLQETEALIEVYGIGGQRLFSTYTEFGIAEIDVSQYVNGQYLLRISSGEEVVVRPFIKQ